ncbi:MAG: alpha-glucosidase [Spirochaetes bacterium]|nr:alpha-glucosidase [Spirochaetota bacterium]
MIAPGGGKRASDGRLWWKHGVIYQIYPRSFYDSNGDGIGDIRGIIEKLDYLEWLGVDAVWLSPVNKSPMYDFGYDISDFRKIDPLFGTDRDFDRLISESHRRGIRIIMDLVINHTSHLHLWFVQSRSSRSNPKRDWYIWVDGVKGRPPNNWRAAFGGSAWEWDRETGQYYLHSFLKEQPDVNWRNAELKKAMFGEVAYWLDRGVDGFRLDVVNWYVKDKKFRDNPYVRGLSYAPRPYDLQEHIFDRNRKRTHRILKEFRSLLDSYPERMAVGEVFSPPPGDPELSASYLGDGEDELHLVFDFSLLYSKWSGRKFLKTARKWLALVPEDGWPCHVLSNHDQVRHISRYARGGYTDARARVAATFLLTLKGTPFIYYGEEIGMMEARIRRSDMRDPAGKKYWPFYRGRDGARTPMQWNGGHAAGFTAGRPWLPVHRGYRSVNVEEQREEPGSLLNFYRRLILLRRSVRALGHGEWVQARKARDGVVAWYRLYEGEKVLVVMNFTRRRKRLMLESGEPWEILISTHRAPDGPIVSLPGELAPYEATVMLCRSGGECSLPEQGD